MFYKLYEIVFQLNLIEQFPFLRTFRVFQYITFRSAYAALTSLLLFWVFGPFLIDFLKKNQFYHKKEKEELTFHNSKIGTPTMGGILIVISIVISTLLWGNLSSQYIQCLLFAIITLGLLGFLDDYNKVFKLKPVGITVKTKFILQLIIACVIILWINKINAPVRLLWISEGNLYDFSLKTTLPFFKNYFLNLSYFYFFLGVLVIIGSSNAVNLTDGLDGLAAGCSIFVAIAYGIIAYLSGHYIFSKYLQIINIKGIGEIAVFIAAFVGALLGFLWYNSYPAEIFMGDTGSLPIGGIIGAIAVMIKQEILLIIVGGVFVVEALSVILQVGSFKLRKKRILKMAPLHHHFELSGYPEPKIVSRFYIIGIILALLTLSTLKLR